MNQLDGLGFSNYRSIGEKPVLLYPFSKVNLFVGPNNCGKSNILRFIHKWCKGDLEFTDDDYPKYNKSLLNSVYRAIPIEETNKLMIKDAPYYYGIISEIKKIIASDLFHYDEKQGIIWFNKVPEVESLGSYTNCLRNMDLYNYSLKYSHNANQWENSTNLHYILDEFFDRIKPSLGGIENSIYIKANRDLFDHSENAFLNGEKIIDKLNKTINHKASDTQAEDDKQNLERFISDFLGYEVSVSVPASLDSINLVSKEKPKEQYSLDQLGSGIHEIIYFALVATLNHGYLICIDEPEIHMHPRLQREYLEYLLNNTDNQYFIATHSSAFINSNNKEVSVFRVSLDHAGFTECNFVSKMNDLSSLVDSLGCKASDIIQSNCVIWVEGPSDRIYLNYWIHGIDPNLVEGIDYSIMFYGGRLLNHLSGKDDSEDQNLINLLSINRNSFVVVDSDRHQKGKPINPTKRRIQKEFGYRCWITMGREIENYLNSEQYKDIARELDSSFVIKRGDYCNLLAKGSGCLDKVLFAKRIVEKYQDPDYSKMDLHEKVRGLVKFITDLRS